MANFTSFLSFSKLKETEELAVGSMPTRWGSDFAAELSGREEGKRPSSPSPSDGQSSSPHSGIAILVYMYITYTLTWNGWDRLQTLIPICMHMIAIIKLQCICMCLNFCIRVCTKRDVGCLSLLYQIQVVHCMGVLLLNSEVVNAIADKLSVNSHELAIHSHEF